MKPPVALTIAGSDSGGGAGIQADLKVFAVFGVHGTTAITAVTAQNTLGVSDYVVMPPHIIRAQIDDVISDFHPAALKTGMLANREVIELVADAITRHRITAVVVDPVMVASAGGRLLSADAVEVMVDRLLPLASIVTPNIPEAEALIGHAITTRHDMERAARELVALGCRAAVVKGGHLEGDADDVMFDGSELTWFRGPRIETPNTHGSGCTFAAALTALLATGDHVNSAIAGAKEFVTGAIRGSLEIGSGHGPVNPMWGVVDT